MQVSTILEFVHFVLSTRLFISEQLFVRKSLCVEDLYSVWCVLQGAATSVYAAVAPELKGHSGAYLQDCHIAQPSSQAQDAEVAQKLWTVTEQQLKDPALRK